MLLHYFIALPALLLAGLPILAADQAVSARAAARPADRVLVLTSGKVVTGGITPRDDGYDIELAAGRIFVASQLVRFQAQSLNDAYLRMRQSLPELTPNHHVELAKWCEANGLDEHAHRELLDALHLDPHRGDAKRMLQSLLKKQSRPLTAPTASAAAADAADLRAVSSSVPSPSVVERRSLGGFSRSAAKAFVQNVQPLLVNKCASGGCHGSRNRDFVLISIRNGSTPSIAERNLAAVLKQIDLNHPESSPLLRASMESHGGSTGPIFAGRTGQTQIEIIRSWVMTVAGELSATESLPSSALLSPYQESAVAARSTNAADGEQAVHHLSVTRAESDRRALQEIEYMNRIDAFDPAVFNQKYHSESQRQATASDNGVQ